MVTATDAFTIIRSRLVANTALPLRFQNEDPPALPDKPTAFVYVEFMIDRPRIVGYGGGLGRNLYRNQCALTLFVFVPRGEGLKSATDKAEALAAIFRSYRDETISCFGAGVIPGGQGSVIAPAGVESEVDNYYWAAAEIDLHFDQVG